MRLILFLLIYFSVSAVYGQTLTNNPSLKVKQPLQSSTQVIIDTDMAGDPGDAGAIAIAAAMHLQGSINLIGVMTNSSNVFSAPVVKSILVANGLNNIAVGAYQGSSTVSISQFTQPVRDRFRPADTRANYIDAVIAYRTLLAAAPNNGVVIGSIGFLTNISALLQSPADSISSLTGIQLVAQKVIRIVIMGGDYPSSASPEYNFAGDPVSAAYVNSNSPVPIYLVGVTLGNNIIDGPLSSSNLNISPTAYAYQQDSQTTIQGGRYTRPGWDEVGVFVSTFNLNSNFSFGGINGTNTVNSSTGGNVWTSTIKNTSYLSKSLSDDVYSTTFNLLLDTVL